MLTEKKKEFIEFMMESDVLRFGDFVTKSGRNTPGPCRRSLSIFYWERTR